MSFLSHRLMRFPNDSLRGKKSFCNRQATLYEIRIQHGKPVIINRKMTMILTFHSLFIYVVYVLTVVNSSFLFMQKLNGGFCLKIDKGNFLDNYFDHSLTLVCLYLNKNIEESQITVTPSAIKT